MAMGEEGWRRDELTWEGLLGQIQSLILILDGGEADFFLCLVWHQLVWKWWGGSWLKGWECQ